MNLLDTAYSSLLRHGRLVKLGHGYSVSSCWIRCIEDLAIPKKARKFKKHAFPLKNKSSCGSSEGANLESEVPDEPKGDSDDDDDDDDDQQSDDERTESDDDKSVDLRIREMVKKKSKKTYIHLKTMYLLMMKTNGSRID
ncbi:hypothetical protein Tco_0425052 [Tanacetum coccineum]